MKENQGISRRTLLLATCTLPILERSVFAADTSHSNTQDLPVVYFAKNVSSNNFIDIYDRLRKDAGIPDRGALPESSFTVMMSTIIENYGKRSKSIFLTVSS